MAIFQDVITCLVNLRLDICQRMLLEVTSWSVVKQYVKLKEIKCALFYSSAGFAVNFFCKVKEV